MMLRKDEAAEFLSEVNQRSIFYIKKASELDELVRPKYRITVDFRSALILEFSAESCTAEDARESNGWLLKNGRCCFH